MTIWSFIYYIGSGVAFLMSVVGLYAIDSEKPKEQQSDLLPLLIACFTAFLSWAVPIWWIGFKIYERKIKELKK